MSVRVPKDRWAARVWETRIEYDPRGEHTSREAPKAEDLDDELFMLGERCADAYMQADALQYRAMKLLAEFHHRRGWEDTGFSSTAEWLAWRIGIKPGSARERVRTALALLDLPQTSDALKNGEVSFAKVRALTRVATPESEGELLELARSGSAAMLERVVRSCRTLSRTDEVRAEELRHRSRCLSAFVADDGMVVIKGRLDPEAGALLMRAIEAAGDALFKEDSEESPERRRADALGLLAERALGAGFTPEEGAPVSGSRAERYQVMLHVDRATLAKDGEPGRSELEDGTRVSAETSRRVCCDAGLVEVSRAAEGQILGVGRKTRTVPPSLRRALEVRDRGCRFPGCGLRFTDAHHIEHWADGGKTELRNLILLCKRHHRAVHEGGVRVCMDVERRVVFFAPNGRVVAGAPPVKQSGRDRAGRGSASPAGHGNGPRARGSKHPSPRPSGQDGSARYQRDSIVPWETTARALEAAGNLSGNGGPGTSQWALLDSNQ